MLFYAPVDTGLQAYLEPIKLPYFPVCDALFNCTAIVADPCPLESIRLPAWIGFTASEVQWNM
jgi:hypothetical protein